MRKLLSLCWFIALVVLVSLGFKTLIWHMIIPVTVTLAQLPWLEFVVNLGAVICSVLFLALIKPLGRKL